MRLVAVCALLLAVGLVAGCAAPAEQAPDQTTPTENSQDQEPIQETQDPVEDDAPAEPVEDTQAQQESQPDRVIQMTGENFDFYVDGEQNPTITVQEGDLVRVEFESAEGFHDFVVDEFGAATEQVRAGDGVTVVEFTADQSGEFEYYCSVGSHRQQGMFGTLIVE